MIEKIKFIHNFFKILDELNIGYWLEGGTALAAYRDGKILPWEHDFDIGIFKEDLDKNLPLFIKRLSKIDCIINVQKNFPFLDNIIQVYSNDIEANPNQIDIYLYTQKGDNIYMRWFNSPIGYGSKIIKSILFIITKNLNKNLNKNINSKSFFKKLYILLLKQFFEFFFKINFLFYKSTYHSFPKKFFYKKIKVDFCNLKLDLPYMIEEFLEYRYGINWKTPDKNFNQLGKWKTSKARPILKQNFLSYPKIDYNIYKLEKYADKKNK